MCFRYRWSLSSWILFAGLQNCTMRTSCWRIGTGSTQFTKHKTTKWHSSSKAGNCAPWFSRIESIGRQSASHSAIMFACWYSDQQWRCQSALRCDHGQERGWCTIDECELLGHNHTHQRYATATYKVNSPILSNCLYLHFSFVTFNDRTKQRYDRVC